MISGDFLTLTAANRRRRQIIDGFVVGVNRFQICLFYQYIFSLRNKVTCERPTNLYGDIFATEFSIPFPVNCGGYACRRRFASQVKNALRLNYEKFQINMNFTTNEQRNIVLVFCSFVDIGKNVFN